MQASGACAKNRALTMCGGGKYRVFHPGIVYDLEIFPYVVYEMETSGTFSPKNPLSISEKPKWRVDETHAIRKRIKQITNNHRFEAVSCFANLDHVVRFLNEGHNVSQLVQELSYFRHERKNIYRIGQSGVKFAKETRLYVFLEEASKTIFILSMGHKETHSADINDAVTLSDSIIRSQEV